MDRLTVTITDPDGRVMARGEIPRDWAEGTRDGSMVSIRCDSVDVDSFMGYRVDIKPANEGGA